MAELNIPDLGQQEQDNDATARYVEDKSENEQNNGTQNNNDSEYNNGLEETNNN